MRVGRPLLWLVILLLAGANVLWLVPWPPSARPGSPPTTGWERWHALTAAERLARVRQYQAIAAREDAAQVWRRAKEFVHKSPEERARLRELAGLVGAAVEEASPALRRQWLSVAASARAYLIYQEWQSNDPQRLEELRARWRRPG